MTAPFTMPQAVADGFLDARAALMLSQSAHSADGTTSAAASVPPANLLAEWLPDALGAHRPPAGSKRRLGAPAAPGNTAHKRRDKGKAATPTSPKGAGKGKGKGPAHRVELAVIDVSDVDDPVVAAASSVVVIPDDSDVEIVEASEDNFSGAASRHVPTAQLRGLVASSKRTERGVLQTVKLMEQNKKEMTLLRADARGMRGLMALMQDQIADVAERSERVKGSNQAVSLGMASILEKLGMPGVAVRAGLGGNGQGGAAAGAAGPAGLVPGAAGAVLDAEAAPQTPLAPWSAELKDVYVADHLSRWCASIDGTYVYDAAAASCKHLVEVCVKYFGVNEAEASTKVMGTFLFPAAVTTSNPSGRSPQRMVKYYRRPLAHERARAKDAFVVAWVKEMVLLGALGELAAAGVGEPSLMEEGVIEQLEHERFWRGTHGKRAFIAGIAAVDKELDGNTGWLIKGTPEQPADFWRVSVPHVAFFNLAVRLLFSLYAGAMRAWQSWWDEWLVDVLRGGGEWEFGGGRGAVCLVTGAF